MAPAEPLAPAELATDGDHDMYTTQSSSRRRSRSGSMQLLARGTSHSRSASASGSGLRARLGLLGVARRTLGITLLLFTVLMWTVSNFLASVGATMGTAGAQRGRGDSSREL